MIRGEGLKKASALHTKAKGIVVFATITTKMQKKHVLGVDILA